MPRAQNGAGSWRQRKTGAWEYRTLRDGKQVSFYGHTQAEALRKADLDKGEARRRAQRQDTLAGWLETWLQQVEGSGLKPATVRKYTSDLRNHVIPALGNKRLGDLTTADIADLQTALLASHGVYTVTNVRRVLGTALQAAVDAGKIPANPAQHRSLRRRPPTKIEHVLTRDETARFLSAARKSRYEAIFVLAVTLGMRQGELLALRWRDIDLDAGTLTIRGNVGIDAQGKLAILTPKTPRSRRTLLLPEIAIDALRRTPHYHEHLVFPAARSGGLMRGTTLTHNYLRAVLRGARLPHMKFHDLRDTAATHMLEDGVAPNVVSEVIGHADEAITLQRYAHVTRGMQQAAVVAMNARHSRGVR